MALQMGLRRGLLEGVTSMRSSMKASASVLPSGTLFPKRWKSGADAGDVIGIDLGTTNSCVGIMVGCETAVSVVIIYRGILSFFGC